MEASRGGFEGPDGWVFERTGGAVCLEFVNTVDNRPSEYAKELLRDYDDLVGWSHQVGILDDETAGVLRSKAERDPTAARDTLLRARSLREALFAVFSYAVEAKAAPAEALAVLNAAIPAARSRQKIAIKGGGFELVGTEDEQDLDRMLPVVVRSAVDLLTSDELSRLRICAAENCGWLFMDRSRNQTRRWCDMSVCGNRAKARRHYRRRKTPA